MIIKEEKRAKRSITLLLKLKGGKEKKMAAALFFSFPNIGSSYFNATSLSSSSFAQRIDILLCFGPGAHELKLKILIDLYYFDCEMLSLLIDEIYVLKFPLLFVAAS